MVHFVVNYWLLKPHHDHQLITTLLWNSSTYTKCTYVVCCGKATKYFECCVKSTVDQRNVPKIRKGCLHYRPTNDKKSLSHIPCERVNTALFQSFPRILVVVSINLMFVIVSEHLSLKCIWVMYWPEHELMCMHEPKQLSFFRRHQQQMSTVQKFRPTRGSILFRFS